MSELTPEQRRKHGEANLDEFFRTVEPGLKAHVVSLPQRISKMNARRDIKLTEVLNTADRIMGHAEKFAACRMGCGHCCYASVPITDFEAKYIGEKINTAPAPIKQSIRRNLNEFSGKTPCHFLKDESCSIYEFRPLTCRIHMNFDIDNYWCLHENWNNPEATIPKPTIDALTTAYHQLGDKLKPVVADIRDFFPNGKASG
jgi:Fe-S-cluster containining protein